MLHVRIIDKLVFLFWALPYLSMSLYNRTYSARRLMSELHNPLCYTEEGLDNKSHLPVLCLQSHRVCLSNHRWSWRLRRPHSAWSSWQKLGLDLVHLPVSWTTFIDARPGPYALPYRALVFVWDADSVFGSILLPFVDTIFFWRELNAATQGVSHKVFPAL